MTILNSTRQLNSLQNLEKDFLTTGINWPGKEEFFQKRYKFFKNRALFVPFVRANYIVGDKNVEDYWLTACEMAK